MSRLEKIPTKLLLTLAFVLLSAIIFLLRINQKKVDTVSAWWDETWTYRQAIEIGWTGTDLTDFQVSFDIGTSALINAGKMQTSCDDIRITDSSGNLLAHWIEEGNPGCNSPLGDTKIWTKLPTLHSGGSTIYIYYGNSSAQNTENGDNVFEFFDDFKGSALDTSKWTQINGTGLSISGGQLTISANGNPGKLIAITAPTTDNYTLRTRFKVTAGTNTSERAGVSIKTDSITGAGYNYVLGYDFTAMTNISYLNDGVSWNLRSGNWSKDTFYTFEIYHDGTSVNGRYNDGSWSSQAWSGRTGYPALNFGSYSSGGATTVWEFAMIRKSATSTPSSTPQSEEVTPGPIAYWKFDEGVGSTAHDSASNNHGAITGATWASEDKCISGKCLYFDGSSKVQIPSSPTFNRDTQTIQFWMNLQENDQWFAVYRPASGGNQWYIYHDNASYARLKWYNNSVVNNLWSTKPPGTNQWHQFTAVMTPGLQIMYADGVEVYRTTIAQSLTATDGDIKLGEYGSPGSYSLIGFLDEVKIYPYARTAEQVKSDYIAGSSSKGSSAVFGHKSETAQVTPLKSKLVARWKFDEGFGTEAKDSIGTNHATFGAGDSAPSWTNNGKSGKALSFDGQNSLISANNISDDLKLTTDSSFTLSAWVNPSQAILATYHPILGNQRSTSLFFGLYNSTLRLGLDDGFMTSTGTVNTNKWSHVLVSYDGGTTQATFYINGQKKNTVTNTDPASSSYTILHIGYESRFEERFSGLIDEVKIYNHALSEDEVKQDYNQGFSAVMGQSSSNTGSTAPAGSASQEYCIPGDSSPCSPPIAEWKFDEGVGTTAYDTSGNSYNGILINNPTWTIGKIGSSLKYNGQNNSVSLGASNNIINGNTWTVSSWFNASQVGSGTYIHRIITFMRTTGDSTGLSLITDLNDKIRLMYADAGGTHRYLEAGTINLNQWYHVSATYDGTTYTVYLNGTQTNQANDTFQGISSGTARIGAYNASNYLFNGLIDNVLIYDYARTPAQIAWDYNRGKPIAHYKLDETSGTTAHDSSGNNLHGTLGTGTSSPTWVSGKLNNAASFDGNDIITVNNLSTLFQNNSFSISSWVYFNDDSTSDKPIISIGTGIANSLLHILRRNNRLHLGFYSDDLSGLKILESNSWYHITATFDSSTKAQKIFINGILDNDRTSANLLNVTSESTFLVGRYSNNYLNGSIDDLRIYNYALTPELVKQVYNNGAVSFN